jgi:UDP-N-acetylmuramate dehydrogenase
MATVTWTSACPRNESMVTLNSDSSALEALASALRHRLEGATVQEKQTLERYTALRIGGPADLLAVVTSVEELRDAVTLCWAHRVPCHILGRGSNVLVSDSGIRGLTVVNRARGITFSDDGLRAESGARLATVARQSVARGLSGLEWAVGIPGTVGGAIVGNAGAWGGDIASALVQASVLEPDGKAHEWSVGRFQYGYRTSILKQPPAGQLTRRALVLDAEFRLQSSTREVLERRVAEIAAQRKRSQPTGASCGSVFRNPSADYAGRLIEAVGLKGCRSGEAEISPVHANFIINHGNATASDVRALIDLARHKVQKQFGVTLELEIQLLGAW